MYNCSMKRLAIFAHYDKDNIIDDYVIYYLRELKKSFETIIFVSDSDLPKEETNKIIDFVDYIQAYHHGEYDWGSYKYGYLIARKNNLLMNTDELLFCNDSVYGPIYSINSVLEAMAHDDCGFWGLYENKIGLNSQVEPHLQSWFLVMKKVVFLSDKFDDFVLSISKKQDKLEIIRDYEIGFTKEMSKYFSYSSAFSSDRTNAVVAAAPKLLKNGFPFLKSVVFKKYYIKLKKMVSSELYTAMLKHSARINKEIPLIKFVRTMKWNSKMRKYIVQKNY